MLDPLQCKVHSHAARPCAVAGNLAWSCGLLGILTALLSNFNAIVGWYSARAEGAGGVGVVGTAGAYQSAYEDEIL